MILLENDFRSALAEQSKSAVGSLYDRTHGLAHRVERVHFVDLVLGVFITHLFVVLTEIEHEAQQSALGLVTDLLRQVSLVLCRLHRHT